MLLKQREVEKSPLEHRPNIDSSGETVIPRTIGLLGGTSFIVGSIIGSGIFISPRGVAYGSGSVALCIVNWFLYGVVAILGGLCFAELGVVVRQSGADYSILHEAFGPLASFMFSWVCVVIANPGGLATLSLTCATYILTPFYGDGCGRAPEDSVLLLAIVILFLLVAINVSGTQLVTRVQVFFTATKLMAMVLIIFGGVLQLSRGSTQHLATGFEGSSANIGRMVTGFYSGMWAYDGWNCVNYFTEDLKKPHRNLPLSIVIGVLLVIVVYVLVNVSYFTAMSIDELIDSPAVAVTWAQRVLPGAAWLMPLFVACSTFGGANACLFTTGRLIMVSARNGHVPEYFGMVHVKNCTPIASYLLTVALTVFYLFARNVQTLMNLLGFVRWVFLALCMIALIMFRITPKYRDLQRPFALPLLIPVMVLCVAVSVVVLSIAINPSVEFMFASLFICAGFLFYVPFVHFKLKLNCFETVTKGMQLMLQVSKPRHTID